MLAYQQREQRFLVGVLVFGVTQNVLRRYLALHGSRIDTLLLALSEPVRSFLIEVDAQRVSGAQEVFWSSLEAYVGWELDSVMCGRGTRAGRPHV